MLANPEILTVILAVIAATGASLMTGLLTRPKMSAEAKAVSAGGEVALSTDARAWAETFRQQAERAEKKADEAERRCDALEQRMNAFVPYALTLQRQVRTLGGNPVEPPAALRPPL